MIKKLAKKLGLKTNRLSRFGIEDWILAQHIDDGIESGIASRDDVIAELKKK